MFKLSFTRFGCMIAVAALVAGGSIAQCQDIAVTVEAAANEVGSGDIASVDVGVHDIAAPYREAAIAKWADDIAELASLDRDVTPSSDAVMLIGSSSIRLWEDADGFFAPRPVVRRGYGGARYTDLVVFAETLITPHTFADLIIFVGNDVSGSDQDKTPNEVEPLVRQIVKVARTHQPQATIHLVEVTPTPKRFAAWPKIRALNAMLREVALTEPHVRFVATAEHYLDREDQPKHELFGGDRLHQNDDGYAVWASILIDAVNRD